MSKSNLRHLVLILVCVGTMATVASLLSVGCSKTPTAPEIVEPTPTPTPAPTPEPTAETPRACQAAYLSIYLSGTDGEVAFPLAVAPWVHAAFANKDGEEIDRRACVGFVPGAIHWEEPSGSGRTPADCEWMGQELAQDRVLKCYSGGSAKVCASATIDSLEIHGCTIFRVVQ